MNSATRPSNGLSSANSTLQKTLRLGQVTQVSFGTILAVMVGVSIVSKLTMTISGNALAKVAFTYQVKDALQDIAMDLVDAETGERGFIFTQNEEFLEPYNNAKDVLKDDVAQVKALLSQNPEQLQRVQNLEKIAYEAMDGLTQAVNWQKEGDLKKAKDYVISGQGKKTMDRFRSQFDEIMAVENELLAERQQAASQAELLSTAVTLGGSAIAFLVGLTSLILINRKVINPINQVTNVIASSSSEIAATIEQQERVSAQQATAIAQTTSTMDELGSSSRQSAEQAEMSAKMAQQVADLAVSGTQAVEHTLDDMGTLKDKVEAIANQILRLSEQTNQIGSIINLVSDLANQTNMLALNAAVEAARAGENGKGFAVVATEIRKLADQSKKSAEKINGLVTDIQSAINSTVMVTDEGTKTVEQGVRTAQGTADTFSNVTEAINSIVVGSQQISLTAKQQAIATQQVVEAMNSLNQGAVQTATGISQTKISTQRLNEAALNLQAVV
jgi:methyl-accepting chemotaxis protein